MSEAKKFQICQSCSDAIVELLEKRIRRILEVGREEAADGDYSDGLTDADIGQSQCFHLMEIQRIISGQKTCGVYDDYGPEPTIEGPLFPAGGGDGR